jgi:tryptophanyl-tRNA synthetase
MTRVFSGVQPSGALHVGNYLGAIREWAADQYEADSFYCVVDLHGLTLDHDPDDLRRRTVETAIGLLAAGLDPDVCTVFVQSHVPAHTELSWLLECTATVGELRRMTQFKEKSRGVESVRAGLMTYPVLMAADILLYDTDRVPVGDDQRQHLELTRDVAIRFNSRYGDTFVVPEATVPKVAARVMDLQHPTNKMSKSVESPLGTVNVLDSPDEIAAKVRKAVTDPIGEVRYDPESQPGLANLIELLAAATSRTVDDIVGSYNQYGPLKSDLTEALVAVLTPVKARYEELAEDPTAIALLLEKGALKASSVASSTLRRAKEAIGLFVPPAT